MFQSCATLAVDSVSMFKSSRFFRTKLKIQNYNCPVWTHPLYNAMWTRPLYNVPVYLRSVFAERSLWPRCSWYPVETGPSIWLTTAMPVHQNDKGGDIKLECGLVIRGLVCNWTLFILIFKNNLFIKADYNVCLMCNMLQDYTAPTPDVLSLYCLWRLCLKPSNFLISPLPPFFLREKGE